MDFPYELPSDPISTNMDPSALDKVVQRFKNMQLSGSFPGGQLVVRRHNRVVLNITTGIARGYRAIEAIEPELVRPNTPFPVYSLGKSLAAIAIAMLEERGVLDLNKPVAKIFPEFGRYGKEKITTLDVLTHTAGVFVPSLYQDYKLFPNRGEIWDRVINARPKYKRGVLAYMPWEYGIILHEIVLRLIGKTLSEFASQEIIAPLNLPSLRYGFADQTSQTCARSYWLGRNRVMVAGVNIARNCEEINNAIELFDSKNPAISLVTDAANLAAFYEFLVHSGVTRTGKQLLSKQVIQQYTTQSVSGWEKSFGVNMAMGRGFMVGRKWLPSMYGWWDTSECFGHVGGFASLAFGDYKTMLAGAIITNGHRSIFDFAKRFIPIVHMLRHACL